MELLLNSPQSKPAGFMIPIPQYPLYTATISEYNAEKVNIITIKTSKIKFYHDNFLSSTETKDRLLFRRR